MNFTELLNFNSTYKAAVGFLELGTDDYVASRCCLLNGIFPGLRLGTEAVEKYLKAFILYRGDNTKYRQSIKDLAAAASNIEPAFSTVRFSHIIDRLETHYRHRYPDVSDFKHDARTDELAGIDEVI
jgi:HEPN domain